jgi:8-amino-3,8-dideoxy-alpha-D-manno-octulosonate transaminase
MAGREWFGAEERKEVMDVLETGILFRYGHDAERAGHWKARDLEHEVSKFTGAKHALAISSGSTAVSCTLAASGIGYGDEVICTPFTYLATNEELIYSGAIPRFAEIDENLCLTAKGIENALTPNTKAVLLVHMCGSAAEMDSIVAVCKKHNLLLIEDCGQALGAFYKGKSVGLFGTCGAFSFDFFKIATCGEGGVFITNDEEKFNTASCYADHGHTHLGTNRGMEAHPILGRNFRLSELNAAVGLAQMRKIEKIRATKKRNKAVMVDVLSDIPDIKWRAYADRNGDSGTFVNFFLPTQAIARKAVDQMRADGVGGFDYWYENMYHFINQWEHLKAMKTPFKLPVHELGSSQDYHKMELPESQHVIGRLLSFGTKLAYSEDECQSAAEKIKSSILKIL